MMSIYPETKTLAINLQDFNNKMFKAKLIEEKEYRKNLKLLIKVISGGITLSLDQINIISCAFEKKRCLARLRLSVSLLRTYFN